MRFQRLKHGVPAGEPGDLPLELIGLALESLADLSWVDPALGFSGVGFVEMEPEPAVAEAVLTSARAERRLELIASYEARYAEGCFHDFGGPGASRILSVQAARDEDRINWLTLADMVRDGRDAGAGSALMPLPIRTTDDSMVRITFDQGKAMLDRIRAWGGAMLAELWRRKDLLAAAATAEEVQAVLLNDWPA